jgi:tetratricopeptide (TPR) repeat protein
MMEGAGNKHFLNRPWLLALVLVVATFAAYQSVWHAGFIWDDDDHFTKNPAMISLDGLKQIWSSLAVSRYYPLTLTSFWAQRRLWGLHPMPYHLVNVALHAVNALLLWALLRRLQVRGAWVAAAIWALHPVNVESVAWVTELKNTQSAIFFFLALLCFLRFAPTRNRWWYVSSVLCGAGAMVSKPSTVVLPLVLLLCLWWQQRLRLKEIGRVVPFFAMALAMSALTITEQNKHVRASISTEWSLSLVERCLLAGKAVWFYVTKVLWPLNLMFVYPRWDVKTNSIDDWLPLVGVVAVGIVLWLSRRQPWARACMFGLGFFAIALLPVLGFFDIYYFRYSFVADHFQYLASLGLIACAANGLVWLQGCWKTSLEPVGNVGWLALLLALGVLTWSQARMYCDAESLYRGTIEHNPGCFLAHTNLGVILLDEGRTQDAISHFERALQANPNSFEADNGLGNALYELGRTQDAIAHFERALRLSPQYYPAHNNLGDALMNAGKTQEAIEHFEWALRINSNYAPAHYNLGGVLFASGKPKEAIDHFERALQIDPRYPEAHNNLGVALMLLGRPEEAIGQFQQALQVRPDYAEPHRNWGHALERLGKVPEAIGQYEQTLRIKPDHLKAHNDLGNALLHEGKVQDCIAQYETALRINPDDQSTQNNLAWVLAIYAPAQGGNPVRAVMLAERACALGDYRVPEHLDTLAAAYAAVGRFDDAIATAQKAAELARTAGPTEAVEEIEGHLQLYREGKVYRQPIHVTSPSQR